MDSSTTILKYAICYTSMFILTWIISRNKSNHLFDSEGNPATNTAYLMVLHFAGIFWFWLVPQLLLNHSLRGLIYSNEYPALSWLPIVFILLVLTVLTGFSASRKIYIRKINFMSSSNTFFNYYFGARILFLCAYELFFRGFLLFDCIKWLGVYPAILITTGLTVLIHVFTSKRVMWACIPFGIVLCSCCIAFNAVWPAIVIHLALSMAYEIPPVHHYLNHLKIVR